MQVVPILYHSLNLHYADVIVKYMYMIIVVYRVMVFSQYIPHCEVVVS